MMRLTRAQAREVDRIAIKELHIPGVVLMENAGRSVADVTLELLRDRNKGGVIGAVADVLCGGGNNGGDGYVIARHLHNAGVNVTAWACSNGASLTGDCAVNHTIADRMLLVRPLLTAADLTHWPMTGRSPVVVVDALLGTGFSGPLRGHVASVIRRCNEVRQAGAAVVAVDLPSGLDCDTGRPGEDGLAIEADVTVTFMAEKAGFSSPQAGHFLGRVVVGSIGAPLWLLDRVAAGKDGI